MECSMSALRQLRKAPMHLPAVWCHCSISLLWALQGQRVVLHSSLGCSLERLWGQWGCHACPLSLQPRNHWGRSLYYPNSSSWVRPIICMLLPGVALANWMCACMLLRRMDCPPAPCHLLAFATQSTQNAKGNVIFYAPDQFACVKRRGRNVSQGSYTERENSSAAQFRH